MHVQMHPLIFYILGSLHSVSKTGNFIAAHDGGNPVPLKAKKRISLSSQPIAGFEPSRIGNDISDMSLREFLTSIA